MKNSFLIILLLFSFAFTNCELKNHANKRQQIELEKGLIIKSSKTIQKREYQLLADSQNEKLITIEGDSLTIDFNNISLIGTNNFTKPAEFKGIAIHIKNSNSVTIKNLNISGYKIALQVDKVKDLTIDSCNFTYNYRADSSANFNINKVEIGAIVLNNSENIYIRNATISHNYNALISNHSTVLQIRNCEVQFNSKVAFLMRNKSSLGEIWNNKIDWNLAAVNWHDSEKHWGQFHCNSLTHNGFIDVLHKDYDMNDFEATDIDFEINLDNYLDCVPKIDPKYPKGEAYKLPTKYGVYNFEYPAIFLRTMKGDEYTFAMFGPSVGNWKFVGSKNVASANLKTGTFPATFSIKKENLEKPFSLDFEFIGERFQDEFGVWNDKGKIYKFGFFEKSREESSDDFF